MPASVIKANRVSQSGATLVAPPPPPPAPALLPSNLAPALETPLMEKPVAEAVVEAPAAPSIAAAAAAAAVNMEDIRQKILNAAVAQGQQIMETARAQATDTLREAQTQAEEIARQARSDGRAEGEAEVAQVLFAAHGLVDEVSAWRERLLARSEPLVLELVADIARILFGQGIRLPQADLQAAFTRALSEAKPLGDLRLHLNPEDAAALGPHWAEQQAARTNPGQKVLLVPDTDVLRGGCLIEGDNGSVDARVDTQLRLSLDALNGVAATPAEDEEGQRP